MRFTDRYLQREFTPALAFAGYLRFAYHPCRQPCQEFCYATTDRVARRITKNSFSCGIKGKYVTFSIKGDDALTGIINNDLQTLFIFLRI